MSETKDDQPPRFDRIRDALLGRRAVRLATVGHLAIAVPLIVVNVVNMVSGFPFFGPDTQLILNLCVILVSSICMTHIMASSHWLNIQHRRAVEEFQTTVTQMQEELRARIEADTLRMRERVDGRPHVH
jgi:hypothetical protein